MLQLCLSVAGGASAASPFAEQNFGGAPPAAPGGAGGCLDGLESDKKESLGFVFAWLCFDFLDLVAVLLLRFSSSGDYLKFASGLLELRSKSKKTSCPSIPVDFESLEDYSCGFPFFCSEDI